MTENRIQKVVLDEIRLERNLQDQKWGVQDHCVQKWLVILTEEVGEACAASLDVDMSRVRAEMVQIAAVAVAAIECYDRRVNRPDMLPAKEMIVSAANGDGPKCDCMAQE